MRVFLYLLLLSSLLFSASVENKIKQNKKQLSSKKIQYKKMDRQLVSVAKKIKAAKVAQQQLKNKLTKLAKNIKSNEAEFTRLQKIDKKYVHNLEKVNKTLELKQKKFLDLISKSFSLSLALESLEKPTPDSIMMKEVYKLYEKKNNQAIKTLKADITVIKKQKDDLKLKKANLQKSLAVYLEERKEYKAKKAKQDKIVANLARDKAIYKKRFNKIKAARRSLERKLAKLKIIKKSKDQAKVATQNSVKRAAKQPTKLVTSQSTTNYRGGKTISPLKGSRLIKKFGTYVDPIYKFKIFNKSITLKAPHSGSKVRSVLAGKVVFAENSGGMLGKVVIVEHANSMHTIYAKLSRLAPGIHVGKQLSKGTIIGKVDKSLMFEVTKNNKHINPTKLIRL